MSQQFSALPALASPPSSGRVPALARLVPPQSSPPSPSGLVPTVFHEPWWLMVASQGRYREVQVQSGGGVVGRLPYLATKRFGMTHIAMPMLTHFLGPAIQEGTGGETARSLHRLSVTKDLIRQLPSASHIYIKHHRATSDTLAFQAVGFHTDVQFTWEIAPDVPDALWRRMRDKTRNVIRRAEEKLQVMEVTDAEKFMSFYEENLRDRHDSLHNDFDQYINILQEAILHRAGRILIAHDRQGAWKAGIFTLRDRSVEYYLMSTRAADSGNGAVSLLVWNAIRDAAARGVIFDFEGVGNDSSTLFFLGFGGQVHPRYISYRSSVASRILSRIPKFRGT